VLHLYGSEYGRVRFHGYRPQMVAAQAEAMGMQSIVECTRADEFDEDFALALGKVREAGLEGVIFGNLWLADVQAFYRERVEAAGLSYVDVLWGEEPLAVLRQFVALGFRAVVTSVWLKLLDRSFLGRAIDEAFVEDVARLDGVDPCGERGEYHSLVHDGPCFVRPLEFSVHGVHEEPENVFLDVRSV
jgi:uncharacterized protein (TIGR00290 family)